MAQKLVKLLGQQSGMTLAQLRREKDHFEQINLALKERDDEIALARGLFRPIAGGRVTTDGVGGFTAVDVRGCTVSLTGGNQRITFDTPRTSALYLPMATALTGGSGRYYTATNITQVAFFDFVLRLDSGGVVNPAIAAIAMAFVVFE